MTAFSELGVMPELTQELDTMDWMLPTEIQSEAIPLILGGGDILMASETGTGKTGAFCIPIVQVVYEQISEDSRPDNSEATGDNLSNNLKTTAWNLSPIDRAQDLVLSQDLLTAQSKSGNWQGCRTNKAIKRAHGNDPKNRKVYYEVHFDEQGLARVGWSLSGSTFDLGLDRDGWGYGGTAKKSNNKQFNDFGLPYGEKFDIVGCIFDLKTGEMSFSKNGRNVGVAFRIPTNLIEERELYPTICVKNAGCHVRLAPSAEKNDFKPNDCIWVSEVDPSLIQDGASMVGGMRSSRGCKPLAIILEPSRELAKQTFDCIQRFSKGLGIESSLLVGGGCDSYEKANGQPHIVVSTPGRLSESVNRNQIPLNGVHFFILDEADGLLQQGLQNMIRTIHNKLPKMFSTGRRLQTICCSATLHNFAVKKLAQELMYFPTWIDLKGEDSVPDTVHHVVLRIDPKNDHIFKDLGGLFSTDGVHANDDVYRSVFDRDATLSRQEELSEAVKLMKFYYTIKAIESLDMDQGIIFCRTKLDCDNLNEFMLSMNKKTNSSKFSCVRLHSSLSQSERQSNLDSFKAKKVKFLLCTDVAARGIDVKSIPYVIQVTLPDEKANYIHRIGRVGRADRMGLAISLVATEPEKVWYHSCNRRDCHNTRLVEKGGCCKWFHELSMLAEIEDHLKCIIQEIGYDFKLQVDEFDGKVVYGAKRLEQASTYEGHVEQLKTLVHSLTNLEYKAQVNYLRLYL